MAFADILQYFRSATIIYNDVNKTNIPRQKSILQLIEELSGIDNENDDVAIDDYEHET